MTSRFLGDLAGSDASTRVNGTHPAFIIVLTVVLGILAWHVAIIIGLWLLKRWAWFLVMMQLGLSLALCLWAYFQGVPLYVYMWLNTILVFYLNQREVQYVFGQMRKPQQEVV